MGQSPLHLTARDFDAYSQEKATSNAYSRPRLEVKQRALAWARGVVARLSELGISVDVHGSDEHPSLRNKKRVDCQWVFFWRDAAAREELDRLLDRGRSIAAVIDDPSPYTRHAFLALRLDAATVEVCFAVHPEAQVDVDNLRALVAGDEAALTEELMRRLRALPEEFAIGVTPADRVAASAATPEVLRSLIERAATGQVPLWIGWSVARDTAIEHADILDEQLEDALIALAPIYRIVAWSRDNDHIALDRRIQSAEEERARAHAEAEAQTEKWRAEQAEARRRSQEEALARAEELRHNAPAAPRRPSLDTLFGSPPQRPGEPQKPRPAAPKPADAEPRASSRAVPHPPGSSPGMSLPRPARLDAAVLGHHRGGEGAPRDAEPRHDAPKPHAAQDPRAASRPTPERPGFEKGAKVRVRTGPFAEKVGTIAELDGKGGARVLLGLLSARLDLLNLETVVEGKNERPAIQSSHRKPLGATANGLGAKRPDPGKARG